MAQAEAHETKHTLRIWSIYRLCPCIPTTQYSYPHGQANASILSDTQNFAVYYMLLTKSSAYMYTHVHVYTCTCIHMYMYSTAKPFYNGSSLAQNKIAVLHLSTHDSSLELVKTIGCSCYIHMSEVTLLNITQPHVAFLCVQYSIYHKTCTPETSDTRSVDSFLLWIPFLFFSALFSAVSRSSKHDDLRSSLRP